MTGYKEEQEIIEIR